jgi:hypothetical protein
MKVRKKYGSIDKRGSCFLIDTSSVPQSFSSMSSPDTPAANTRAKRNAQHAARLSLINRAIVAPADADETAAAVQLIISSAAEQAYAKIEHVPHDGGRVTAALDSLHQANSFFRDALLLPHAPKE